jgi:hypothetical protein
MKTNCCPVCGEILVHEVHISRGPDPKGLAKVIERYRQHNDRVETAQRESERRLLARKKIG